MNWQVFDAVGIALGYTANLISSTQRKRIPGPSHDWKLTCGRLNFLALADCIFVSTFNSVVLIDTIRASRLSQVSHET